MKTDGKKFDRNSSEDFALGYLLYFAGSPVSHNSDAPAENADEKSAKFCQVFASDFARSVISS